MKTLIGALLLASLAACSSEAITLGQTTPAPADQLYAFQAPPTGPSGRLTVMRDGGVHGAACDVVVYVNGTRAAKLGTGERATFQLAPGRAILGVGLTETGLCTGADIRTIDAPVQANTEQRYRISSSINGWLIVPYKER